MAKVGKFEAVTGLFSGQGDLFIFDALTDSQYETATLSTLANPQSLGQVVQDSTSWDGADPEVTELKDEQGNIVTAKTAAGTLAFSFDLASTSSKMIQKFMNGIGMNVELSANAAWAQGGGVTGFGTEIPVVTIPVAIVNDGLDKTWLYPKTKITSGLKYDEGVWRLHCACIAEYIDTDNLKTGMLIEAKVNY